MTTARGLAPATWVPVLSAAPEVDLDPLLRAASVTIVAAHPDDETLGAAGILRRLARAGVIVRVVVMTDGEAAYADPDPAVRRDLAERRRLEVRAALAVLGHHDVELVFAGLPDGGLADRTAEVTAALADLDDRRTAWLAPWAADPHPDHRAVGGAVLAVAGPHRVWQYPIWLRHGLRPDQADAVSGEWQVVRLSTQEMIDKDAAVRCHVSQIAGPSADVGPVLPDHVLELFSDGLEPLLPAASPLDARQRFADAYDRSPDPFQVRTRWYEQRKLDVTMATLPRRRYRRVWEPACGIGELTARLATRCEAVVAQDPSPTAVHRVRSLLADSRLEVSIGALPADVPVAAGSVDLVVVSEVLYYLSAHDRRATLSAAHRALTAEGDLVLVHWRDWPEDAWVSGDAAHAEVRTSAEVGDGWRPLAHHRDERFVVDVLRRA